VAEPALVATAVATTVASAVASAFATGLHRGHRGTRAVQRMVEFAPSTGGLALWVLHTDVPVADGPDPKAPLVATDGQTLFYAPAFERLPLAEQVGLVAHAVLHVALRHPQRFIDMQRLLGDVDLPLFNVCADAIVNSTLSHLSWLELPANAVLLDRLLASALNLTQGVEKSLLEWDVEQLYRAIDDRRQPPQGGRRQGPQDTETHADAKASAGGSAATGASRDKRTDGPRAAAARALGARTPLDLLPGASTQAAPEAEAEAAREWCERLLRAHAGDGAFSMLRTLLADLPRSRTPWEQVLRTQLARALTPQPAISWSRPARSYLANQGRAGPKRSEAGRAVPRMRMPWEPGFSGYKTVPRLVLIVDVSGSIEDGLMKRFATEIEAIARRLEAGVVLVIGDERVQSVARFEPGGFKLEGIEFKGGGGTDFTPLLEEADKHRPDIGVVLTDLEGPARFRPRWPVIWAVPEACAGAVAPFGRKLGLR
jgi:predicted metal-dependent peptidase